jgi:TPR repeat protein
MTQRSAKFFEAMDAYDEDRPEEALRLMEECAQQGDPIACFTAALWYRNGEGAPESVQQSAEWLARLEELAEQGNTEAQWELGQHYRFANLVPLDIERANHWLEHAAEGGYGEAQHHLAWYFEYGQYGYPVDPNEAAKWYQRAFEKENPETLYMYAVRLFRDGRPTEEAIQLLRRAADRGFKQAEHALNSCTH